VPSDADVASLNDMLMIELDGSAIAMRPNNTLSDFYL